MQPYEQDIEKLLAEGNSIQIKPKGYSMYPVLVPGRDAVIVEPLTKEMKLKRGDVVLYRRFSLQGEKDILVLHRIWKIKEQGIFLVGDNQKETEGPLKREQMLGRASQILRNGKKISVRNPVYRGVCGIWLILRPFRPMISKAAVTCKRIICKNKK